MEKNLRLRNDKVKVEKVIKIKIKSYPTHVHFCRPGRKHVQSFKKTGLKLYEKLQWHGTHWLYRSVNDKIEKEQRSGKKYGKDYMKSMCTSSDYGQNICKVPKKISIKLYEELCSLGSHCLYIEGEKWLSMWKKWKKEKEKKNLTITSKSHAHTHTMK